MRALDIVFFVWLSLNWAFMLFVLLKVSRGVKIASVEIESTALAASTEDGTPADDEMILRMLAGARFGPNASLTLPSGRVLSASEAQVLTSFYAEDAGDES